MIKTYTLPCQACGGMLQVPGDALFVNCEFCGQLNGIEKTHGQVSLRIERQFDAVALGVRIPYWEKKLAEWQKLYSDAYYQHKAALEGLAQRKMELASAKARFVWLGLFLIAGIVLMPRVSSAVALFGGHAHAEEVPVVVGALAILALAVIVACISAHGAAKTKLADAEELVATATSACARAECQVQDFKDKIAHAEAELEKLDN